MTRGVTVYGFGSVFGDTKAGNDVDLLIIHYGTDPASGQFAIICKRRLTESVARAHITMLSDSEDSHCQFIKTARAACLGTIRPNQLNEDLTRLDAAPPKLDR